MPLWGMCFSDVCYLVLMDNQVEQIGAWSRLYLLKALLSDMPLPHCMLLNNIQLRFSHIFGTECITPGPPLSCLRHLCLQRHTLVEVGTPHPIMNKK